MPAGTEAILTTAVAALQDVLATMFFAEAEPVECRHPEGDASEPGWMTARVCFSGVPAGEFHLLLPPEVAVVFAAGFLGIDNDEVTTEAASQVIGELANMICGAILSRVHPDSLVALSAPELIPVDFARRVNGEHCRIHQCFAIPEGMLAIHLSSDAW
jgi:hypothetical protein